MTRLPNGSMYLVRIAPSLMPHVSVRGRSAPLFQPLLWRESCHAHVNIRKRQIRALSDSLPAKNLETASARPMTYRALPIDDGASQTWHSPDLPTVEAELSESLQRRVGARRPYS